MFSKQYDWILYVLQEPQRPLAVALLAVSRVCLWAMDLLMAGLVGDREVSRAGAPLSCFYGIGRHMAGPSKIALQLC